jgi:hypothetical protein
MGPPLGHDGHGLFVSGKDPHSNLTAVFEDDGKVAYAYVVEDEKIVGDVWLYNRAPTPDDPEWDDRARAPFLNPRPFAVDERVERAAAAEDVSFDWTGDAGIRTVTVSVRGRVLGRLARGQRPGFATLAQRDGPLARTLRLDGVEGQR